MLIEEIIKYNSESYDVDFKKVEYPLGKVANKNEFLKDISAMANHPSNDKKHIIVGVVEKNGVAESFVNIPKLTDQAKYQEFIDNNIEPQINFQYKQVQFEGYNLGYFEISNNNQRPYLFKKNLQNPSNKNIEYKIGDGYIRIGTSTRKMNRSDFENIYKTRNEAKDRKSDLSITPYLKNCTNTIMREKGFKCIDFKIENSSNKSIYLDAEAHFFYNEDLLFSKKFDIDKMIIEESKKSFNSGFSMNFNPIMDNSIFDLSFENTESSFQVVRFKRLNQNAAIEISQNDQVDSIFLNEVLVYKKSDVPIIVQLIIRSDDFVEGALKQHFEI